MRLARLAAWAAPALVLLALPQFAAAGPVRWGYRGMDENGVWVREMTGLTETSWSDFFFQSDPQYTGTYVPDPNPDNGLKTDIRRLTGAVHITDEASGDSFTVGISWDYVFQYEWRNGEWDPYYEGYNSWPSWNDPVQTELGGNLYSVKTLGGEVLITVTPGVTSNTPEPGTLALAGLGLGGVGLVRRLRRGRTTAA